jgi:hypothetical protein
MQPESWGSPAFSRSSAALRLCAQVRRGRMELSGEEIGERLRTAMNNSTG